MIEGLPVADVKAVVEAYRVGCLAEEWLDAIYDGDVLSAENMAGLGDGSTEIVVYHATVADKLEAIRAGGMRAFSIVGTDEPRIYVTPSPSVALWHSIVNGPHDLQREMGRIAEDYADGRPILLVIRAPKGVLKDHPDSLRPGKTGWVPDRSTIPQGYTRYECFIDELYEDIMPVLKIEDCTELGEAFPMDTIPPDWIYMRTVDGDVPITGDMGGLREALDRTYSSDALQDALAVARERFPESMDIPEPENVA